MEYLKFLVKINNVLGYILIATIILSPIGLIQVLLGNLIIFILDDGRIKQKNN